MKRPFILLEVLIAISILALVIVPLSSFPFKAMKKEREMITLIECERIFGLVHADFLAHLQEHPSFAESIDLGDYELSLTSLGKWSYHATAELSSKKAKDQHNLYKVTLSLKPSLKQALTPPKKTFSLYHPTPLP